MSLEGKTAVVIGASGQHNFGVAIAKALANEGAKVIVSGRRQAPLETLASEIGGIAIPCDMGDEASIQSLFQSASEQAGPVHIAINSAGALAGNPIAALTREAIHVVLDSFHDFWNTTSPHWRVQRSAKAPVKSIVGKAQPIVDMVISDANKPFVVEHESAIDDLVQGLLVDNANPCDSCLSSMAEKTCDEEEPVGMFGHSKCDASIRLWKG